MKGFEFCTLLPETDSTNNWLWNAINSGRDFKHGDAVRVSFQTNGRGQIGNTWESERGKNLLCSFFLLPEKIQAKDQFIISQAVALSVCDFLDVRTTGISIKWPNDIYYHDKKIAGILIENVIEAGKITKSVVGIGLNLNQTEFLSDAPNPISLVQIINRTIAPSIALKRIRIHLMSRFWQAENTPEVLQNAYLDRLYKKGVKSLYEDRYGEFYGTIIKTEPDGRLLIEDDEKKIRSYLFKEVKFK